jgi:hypothetical protein
MILDSHIVNDRYLQYRDLQTFQFYSSVVRFACLTETLLDYSFCSGVTKEISFLVKHQTSYMSLKLFEICFGIFTEL